MQTARVVVVVRRGLQGQYSGFFIVDCKGQDLWEAAKEIKWLLQLKCCHSEYGAAVLHYQCMNSTNATLDGKVCTKYDVGFTAWVCANVCMSVFYVKRKEQD